MGVEGGGVQSGAGFAGQLVEYRDGDVVLEGYWVKPVQDVVAPVVLVVHQWAGLGPYEMRRADMLARLGFAALAVDIYGKGVRPTVQAEKAALAGQYKGDRALFRSRLIAGLEFARAQPGVQADNVAAIGYCFGGTGVLELARMGAPVRGVVSFHGGLDRGDAETVKPIRAKVLVLHGADDPFVPEKDIAAFIAEMREAQADWQMVTYGNAVHSFTDESAGNDSSRGAAYNREADLRSWEAMQAFLREVLRN